MIQLVERSAVVDPKLRSTLEHAVEEFGGDAKLVMMLGKPVGFVFFDPSGLRFIWDARFDDNWVEEDVLEFVRRERSLRCKEAKRH